MLMTAQLHPFPRRHAGATNRHPAVHHLNGGSPRGHLLACRPNGAGKSPCFAASSAFLKPLEGTIATGISASAISPICADRGYRSQLSDLGVRFCRHPELWRSYRILSVAWQARVANRNCGTWRSGARSAVGLNGFDEPQHRHAVPADQMQRMLVWGCCLQGTRA